MCRSANKSKSCGFQKSQSPQRYFLLEVERKYQSQCQIFFCVVKISEKSRRKFLRAPLLFFSADRIVVFAVRFASRTPRRQKIFAQFSFIVFKNEWFYNIKDFFCKIHSVLLVSLELRCPKIATLFFPNILRFLCTALFGKTSVAKAGNPAI